MTMKEKIFEFFSPSKLTPFGDKRLSIAETESRTE